MTKYREIDKMIIILMSASYHCLNLRTVVKIQIIDIKLIHLLS